MQFDFNVKKPIKDSSQQRFGYRKVTTSKNKIKDTPNKQGYHLDDYNRQCVYLHYYNDEELPFYVGTGTLQRAFVFSGTRRNDEYNNKAKDINLIKVVIVKIDIYSNEAINLEKELVTKYKLIKDGGSLVNVVLGGRGGSQGKYGDNKLSIPINQLNTSNVFIKRWSSAKEAADVLGFDSSSISKCCKKVPKYNTHKGYKWEYANTSD